MQDGFLYKRLPLLAEEYGYKGGLSVLFSGECVYRERFGCDKDVRYTVSAASPLLLTLSVLILCKQKKLLLSDPLSRYLPEYIHSDRLTVQNLIERRTGIPDILSRHILPQYINEACAHDRQSEYLRERELENSSFTFYQTLGLIGSEPLLFPAGQRIYASFSELIFMAELIERTSGGKLFQFESENIFLPLGMTGVCEGIPEGAMKLFFTEKGCMRLMPECALHPFSLLPEDAEKLARSLGGASLLPSRLQKKLLSTEESPVFVREGSFLTTELCSYGSGLTIGIAPALGVSFAALSNSPIHFRCDPDGKHSFTGGVSLCLAERLIYPKSPLLHPFGSRNCATALCIDMDDSQRGFVVDPKTVIATALSHPKTHRLMVLEERGTAVGLLLLEADKKRDVYHIAAVIIDRRFQGRGFGRHMLNMGIDYMKKQGASRLTIGVNRKNLPAQRLYASLGFKISEVFESSFKLSMEL